MHRRWCQENITWTHRSWIIHVAIKRRRDNVKKKKPENVNGDTIGNEIVPSDQLVNAMQCIFSYAEPEYTKNVIYFVKRTIGD